MFVKSVNGKSQIMELTQEQRAKIEDIINGLRCSKDFKCTKSGFDTLCKAVDIGFESILECLDDSKEPCKFKVFKGGLKFCTCPLRCYIAKNLKK